MDHLSHKAAEAREGAATSKAAPGQPDQPLPAQESDQDETSFFKGRDGILDLRDSLEDPLMSVLAQVANVQLAQHGDDAVAAKEAEDVAKLDAAVDKLKRAKEISHIEGGQHVRDILARAAAHFYDVGLWHCTTTVLLESAQWAALPVVKYAAESFPDLKAPAELLQHIDCFYVGLGLEPDM